MASVALILTLAWCPDLESAIMSLLDQLEVISRVFNTNPVNHNWASRREGVAFILASSYIFYNYQSVRGSTESCLLLVVESNVFHWNWVWGALSRCLWNCGFSWDECQDFHVILVNSSYEFSSSVKYKITNKWRLEFKKKQISYTSLWYPKMMWSLITWKMICHILYFVKVLHAYNIDMLYKKGSHPFLSFSSSSRCRHNQLFYPELTFRVWQQKMASFVMGSLCSITVLRPSKFLLALFPLIYSSVCFLSLLAGATKKERRKGRRDVRWMGSEDTEILRWLSVFADICLCVHEK